MENPFFVKFMSESALQSVSGFKNYPTPAQHPRESVPLLLFRIFS